MEVCKKCLVELYCPDCDAEEIAKMEERCSICGLTLDVCPNKGQGDLFKENKRGN